MSVPAFSRNFVTEMSFSSRSSVTAVSSSKKLFKAELRNLVTEMSLSSRNLPTPEFYKVVSVDVPRN